MGQQLCHTSLQHLPLGASRIILCWLQRCLAPRKFIEPNVDANLHSFKFDEHNVFCHLSVCLYSQRHNRGRKMVNETVENVEFDVTEVAVEELDVEENHVVICDTLF